MKSYCVKDHRTGHIFKVLFTAQVFQEFLKSHPDIHEWIECLECDDAPSICIE